MKRLFIAIFAMLAVVTHAQRIVSSSEYNIGTLGFNASVDIKVISIDDGEASKYVRVIGKTQTGRNLVASMKLEEVEGLLIKIDELRGGIMNFDCDYFDKAYVLDLSSDARIEVGYYIKTKLDTSKSQQWYIRITDTYEYYEQMKVDDIYKTLGKALSKAKAL